MKMFLIFLITVLRFILTATRPFSNILLDFIHRIIYGRQKPLPPIRSRILLMSATELAYNIRNKKITSEEVIRAYISRIKEVNPILNACVDQRFELALADAKAVDRMLQAGIKTEQELARDMPLLGVPFSCKEIIGVKGMTQTDGLLFFKDRKAPSDGDVVSAYKTAGAIPLVVTNVPTLSMWWDTSNLVFGRTLNPYNNYRAVGGSSGGEGAILSSAGAVIGIGTDIGGSIRIPAAFCGIYGHKPSRGIISNKKPWPLVNAKYDPFRSTGPMCRYVQDLKLLVRLLSGDGAQKLQLDNEVDFRKLKIYYMENIPGYLFSSTPEIKTALRKAVDHFGETYGNTATKLHLKEMAYAFDIWQSKFVEVDGPPLRKGLVERHGKINWNWELVKSMFNYAEYDFPIVLSAIMEKEDKDKHYYKCLQVFEDLQEKLDEILTGNAVLLLPTHPEPAPHILATIPKVENIAYTCIFNTLGYPVTNIPAGMSNGIPICIQAVSASYQDHLTLATAVELDKVFKGWNSPSLIEV